MALSANYNGELYKDGKLQSYKVAASTHIYKGALVCINSSGYLVPGADTSGLLFVGVAFEEFDNSAGADGAAAADGRSGCRVRKSGDFLYTFTASTSQADVGKAVYLSADNTVALAATTTNDVLAGYITEYVTSTSVRVRIDRAVQ